MRVRTCGACGAQECRHDTREPWTKVLWHHRGIEMVDDICAGCWIRPLKDLVFACEQAHEARVEKWRERLRQGATSTDGLE